MTLCDWDTLGVLIGGARNWNFITINPNHVFLLFGHALILLLHNLRAQFGCNCCIVKNIFMDFPIKTYNIGPFLEPFVLFEDISIFFRMKNLLFMFGQFFFINRIILNAWVKLCAAGRSSMTIHKNWFN